MSTPNIPKNAGPVEWIGPDHPLFHLSGLVHCARVPQAASLQNPAPVVVMAHGWGGNESAMWLFKQVVSAGAAIITPRAPIQLENGGYIWFEYDSSPNRPNTGSLYNSLAGLAHFLAALPDIYPVDPQRLVLMGFSQGAAICNSLVLTRPGMAKGVASLAGFIPETLPLSLPNGSLAGLPVFIAHGIRDEIVPVGRARSARRVFSRLGAHVTYGEYGAGHKIHTEGIRALKQWLAGII